MLVHQIVLAEIWCVAKWDESELIWRWQFLNEINLLHVKKNWPETSSVHVEEEQVSLYREHVWISLFLCTGVYLCVYMCMFASKNFNKRLGSVQWYYDGGLSSPTTFPERYYSWRPLAGRLETEWASLQLSRGWIDKSVIVYSSKLFCLHLWAIPSSGVKHSSCSWQFPRCGIVGNLLWSLQLVTVHVAKFLWLFPGLSVFCCSITVTVVQAVSPSATREPDCICFSVFFLSHPLGAGFRKTSLWLPGLPVGPYPCQLLPHHPRHPRPLWHHPVPATLHCGGEYTQLTTSSSRETWHIIPFLAVPIRKCHITLR